MAQERTMMFSMTARKGRLTCTAGVHAGRRFEVHAGTFTIGRGADNSLPLVDDQVASRVHAKIFAEGDGYVLTDNDSRNGTLVNGVPVRRADLRDGDEIRIGACSLLFRFEGDGTVSAPTKPPPRFTDTSLLRSRDAETKTNTQRPPTSTTQTPVTLTHQPPPAVARASPSVPRVVLAGLLFGAIGTVALVAAAMLRKPALQATVAVEPTAATPTTTTATAAAAAVTVDAVDDPIAPIRGDDVNKPNRDPRPPRNRPPGSPPPDKPPPGASAKREPAAKSAPAAEADTKSIPVLVDAQMLRHNLVGNYKFESIAVKNGAKVQAGQRLAVISDGAKSSPLVAEAAGTLEELTAKVGEPCPRGRIFGRVSSGLVRATIASSEAGNFNVGAKVTLKKKAGGNATGTIVRINGPTLIIDPAPAAAQTISQLLVSGGG